MSGGLVTAALRLAGMAGRFVLLLLLGRLLSPEELGTYGLFAVTCVLLVQIVGLELHQPALREILRRGIPDGGNVVRAQMRVYSRMYLMLAPAALIVHSLGILSTTHAVLLVVVIVGSHLSMEAYRLLIASSRPERAFFVLSLSQGLWVFPLGLAMILLPSTRSLTAVFLAWACATILATFIGYVELRRTGLLEHDRERRADMDFLRQAWPSAAIFAASSTAFLLVESIDRYFLAQFRSHAELGVYTLYASIARALREIAYAAIVAAAIPTLVGSAQRNDLTTAVETLKHIRRRLTRFILVGTPCLALGLVVVLPHLNDARYAAHLPAYFVLLASAVAGTFALGPHYLLYAAGRERSILGAHLATLGVSMVTLWTLVPRYGIDGAAAASLIAALSMLAFKWAAARNCLRGA